MTSAVLYRWRLKPGREAEFAAAWAEGTALIHKACGSYGARLHEGSDGLLWSYAAWPSEESRQKCFKENNWFEMECFRVMQDCIAERFEEIPLGVVEDGLFPIA